MNTPDTLFAIVLLLASMLAALVLQRARSDARTFGFLAAALFAVLALSQILRGTIGDVAALVTLATAPVSLTLAAFHKFAARIAIGTASVLLAVAAAAGFFAGWFGHPGGVIVILLADVIALIVLGALHLLRSRREALLVLAAAFALAAGGASFVTGQPRDFALFAAAALLGIALAVSPQSRAGVKKQAWKSRTLSVHRKG